MFTVEYVDDDGCGRGARAGYARVVAGVAWVGPRQEQATLTAYRVRRHAESAASRIIQHLAHANVSARVVYSGLIAFKQSFTIV